MTLTCRKEDFSLGGTHYLNCAYMAPFSKAVEQAGVAAIQRRRLPGINLTRHHFLGHAAVRQRFAKLINALPSSVAVTPASSYGLAIVAKNTRLSPNQNVVIPWGEMPTDYLVWERLCAETGAQLRIVVPGEDPRRRADDWNDRLVEAIDSATGLVFVCNVHWLDGTLFDLSRLRARCDEVGAALVVDGTQSLGVLPLDVERVPVDALVCAGYKWLLGPYSLGAAYFGPRYRDGVPLEENWINREHSVQFEELIKYQSYREGAARHDYGEAGNFVLAPMLATALDQLLSWGVDEIARYCRGLTGYVGEQMQRRGFEITPHDQRAGHYIGVALPERLDSAEILAHFQRFDVIVSIRSGFVRLTPNVYNDLSDIEAFLEAMEALREESARRRPVS